MKRLLPVLLGFALGVVLMVSVSANAASKLPRLVLVQEGDVSRHSCDFHGVKDGLVLMADRRSTPVSAWIVSTSADWYLKTNNSDDNEALKAMWR